MESDVIATSQGQQRVWVEFRRIQSMSCKGNHRIRVDADGAVFVDVATRDCPPGEHWNGPWPDVPVRRLSAAEMDALAYTIVDAGFFALPPEVVRQGHDGFRDELDVRVGERTHSVVVERAPPPQPFVRVRAALWKLAGPPFSA